MTIEEIIRQKNREYCEDEIISRFISKEVFTQDCTERKIKAAKYFAPILKERYGEKYPKLDFEAESASFTVMSSFGPDWINKEASFIFAISIFILDSIYQSEDKEEKIGKLRELLKDDIAFEEDEEPIEEYFENNCIPYGSHPYYPDFLLENISSHIAFRNKDYVFYRKNTSKGSYYPFICDSFTTSIKKNTKGKTSKIREVFDSIISLVDPRDKQEAIDEFKVLFFDLIDKYIECRNNLDKAEEKITAQLAYLKLKFDEEYSSAEKNMSHSDDGFCLILQRQDELFEKKAKLEFTRVNYNDYFVYGSYSDPFFIDRYVKPFSSVIVPDPYKVIAGYFYLLESGDDYAWLLGPAMAACSFAANLLPWTGVCIDNENEVDEISEDVKKCHSHSSDFYMPKIDIKKLGISSGIPEKISAAKLIWLYTNGIVPRYSFKLHNEDEIKKEINEELFVELEQAFNLSFYAEGKMYYESPLRRMLLGEIERSSTIEEELSNVTKKLIEFEKQQNKGRKEESCQNEELLEEINKLAERVEVLNRSLIASCSDLDKAKREISKLKKDHKNEQEELYSLRDLIFVRDNSIDEDSEEPSNNIYPYKTKCEIIVMGGHAEWLKRMKALLPSVKFYGDRVPTKEALRHTDVLWFQTLSGLSHSIFYKTMDMVKTLDIPVKYFITSGSSTSADAIVEDDKKRSN